MSVAVEEKERDLSPSGVQFHWLAWIKLAEGTSVTAEEVREFCQGKIAHFKIPRYILFVDEFPMTITGKVQKFKMREETVAKLGLQETA